MTALRRNVLNMVELIPEESLFPVYSYISDILKEKSGKDEAYEETIPNLDEEEESEDEKIRKRKAAFQTLVRIREKAKTLHLKSLEEERFEAMAEKYPFLMENTTLYKE